MMSDDLRVFLAPQPDYEETGLAAATDRLLSAASSGMKLSGARVLLKPNLLTTNNCALSCTDRRVMLAAARWFLDAGAKVSLGDSPAFGRAASVLAALGALAPLKALGVEIVEFDRRRPVELAHGVRVGLAVAALDCDVFVNLPRIKAHPQARITMAVKNHFGCVSGFQKPLRHMIHGDKGGVFFDLIASIPGKLPPALHLVDGITVMHKRGPTYGKPFTLGCMAAGRNAVAVDTALLAIVGLAREQSPLWQAARRLGLPGTDFDALDLDRDLLESLKTDKMSIPEVQLSVRFNPARFVKNSIRRLWLRLAGK